MYNILIFYGGKSTEHDVSIITAMQFKEKFDDDKYNVKLCYISRENKFYIGEKLNFFDSYRDFNTKGLSEVIFLPGSNAVYSLRGKKIKRLFDIDFAFNCCHGGIGESGVLSGFMSIAGINMSSCSHTSLGITYDKVLTKKVAESSDIPVVPYIVLSHSMWKNSREIALSIVEKFGYPVVVKPARQGSSVGVTLARDEDEFIHAMRIALEFDNKILIERMIENKREFNVSCIGSYNEPIVSEVEEVISSGIMTFSDKYSGGKKGIKVSAPGIEMPRKLPADITKKLESYIKFIASRAYELFELSGVVRFDFIMDTDKKEVFLSEINTIPGSMSSYFWEKINLPLNIMAAAKKLKDEDDFLRRDFDIHLL